MKSCLKSVCGVLALALAAGLFPTRSEAAGCTIAGAFIYSYTGLIGTNYGLTNINSFRPTATAGRIVFQNGNLSGSQTDNSTGSVFQITYTGTYTLNTTTCSGTLTRTFENGFQVTEDFVATSDGREIKFVRTSPALFIVAGTMTRQ